MLLTSLLNDGPSLTISHNKEESSIDFSWCDLPLIGDVQDFVDDRPLERNQDVLDKCVDSEFLPLSTCSSFSSWSGGDSLPVPIKKKSHKKSVSFSRFMEIRQHDLTIGDHPLCKDALPLSLAWEHGDTEMLDLESFEQQRQGSRRSGSNMKLSYFERKNMLRNIAGMTEAQMREHQRLHESLPSSRNLCGISGLYYS